MIRDFVMEWEAVADRAHAIAIDKGWWGQDRSHGEIIALMHSELSEALEAIRNNNPPSDHIPEYSSLEEEYADVVIRIMDHAKVYGLRVAEAIAAKMDYNATRPHKHGGKKF